MLPFSKSAATLVATGHPADDATSTTLTPNASESLEASTFESFKAQVFLKDAETGAKSVVFSFWTKDTADGTVGDGTWTAVVPASPEGALSQTLSAAAAYSGLVESKVPMRLFSKRYAAAKAVVTHCDPTATPVTFLGLIYVGEIARRDPATE